MRLLCAVLIAAALLVAAVHGADDVCGADCTSVYVPQLFTACLLGLNGTAILPTTDLAAWDRARRVFNARTLRSPAAIYYPDSTEDVAAAVKCAYDWGVAVSPAAGRQGFQGWAVPDGALVIDVSPLTETSVSADNSTFAVGAGNANIMTMSALHDTGIPGAAVTTGVCIFVGSAGFNLGGGFGPLGRFLGLGCDSVVGLTAVLANGTVVQANATSHPDLLWASCGGGGGTFALVTSFTYKISRLPNDGRLSSLAIQYAPGVNSTVAAWTAFQRALPSLDPRFGFTHDLTGGRLALQGLFLGEPAEGLRLLREAGMLENLDPEFTADASTSDLAAQQASGVVLKAWPSYYDMLAELSVPTWVPAGMAPWGDAANFTATPDNLAWAAGVMAGQPRIVGGPDYNTWHYSQSRLAGALPEETIQAIAEYSLAATEACEASGGTAVECSLSIGGHVLGGKYAERGPTDTAFPWRDSLFVLDAVVNIPSALVDSMPPEMAAELAKPAMLTDDFLRIIKPVSNRAYVNYQPPALAGYQEAYWGPNAARLAAIKAAYDPLGTFNKPYTVAAALAGAPDGGAKGAQDTRAAPAPTSVPAGPVSAAAPRAAVAWLVAAAAAAVAALL